MKILFIGWFIKNRNGDGIVRAFEQLGNTVYKIAMDTQVKETLSPHDLHIRSYVGEKNFDDIIRRNKRVRVSELLKLFPDADMVYIYQTSVSMNTENLDIPVVYYHHEVLLPNIPFGRIDLIFYNYHGCEEQLDKIYRDRLLYTPFVRFTFGMELDRYTFYEGPRNILMGFKGAFRANNPNNDPAMEGIYINRIKYIQYAKDHCECQTEGFVTNPYAMDQLIYFLQQCNVAINVPGCIGNWGFNNERMYLAMALGCVLLQYRYPKCGDDHLVDYENCLLFSNEEELQEKYEWIKNNMDELDVIRRNGNAMVRTYYNHVECVKNMLINIKKYIKIQPNECKPVIGETKWFQLDIPPKKLNILLIGDISLHATTMENYYNELQKYGNVCWVGHGSSDVDTAEMFEDLVYNNDTLFGKLSMPCKLLMFKDLPVNKNTFDLVIHFQNEMVFNDPDPLDIPYIYVWNQIWNNYIPNLASLVIPAQVDAARHLQYYYPNRFPSIYAPFPLQPEYYNLDIAPLERRPYKSSFTGELYEPFTIYEDRREVIIYCCDETTKLKDKVLFGWASPMKNGKRTIEQQPGRLTQRSYKKVLLNTMFGLNCPTRTGFNFRDLEVPACGAILVTKRTQDLDALGFKHGVNCFFYDTKEEALEIITQEYTVELEDIALRGYTLVNTFTVEKYIGYIIKCGKDMIGG